MAAKLRDAAARGATKDVLRLLEDGAKVLPDEVGRTALHLAAAGGHADVVAALLLAGCDVNITDGAGCTALQHAAADGHLEVVRQLIQHGADVNHQDSVHGNTALHEASWKGWSRSVAALGRARANLHLKNCGGFAPLHLCCQNGHNQSCRELLLAGCSPNLQNNYGDTPLHTSARYGHAGVTRILISANCRVSDQNKNGDTALHIAAAMGRRKLTRILLEAGCDRTLKNKQNETAHDIAARKDLVEILALLSGATPPTGGTRGRSSSGGGGGKAGAAGAGSKGDKKREKNESGTSSKDSSGRHKDKKKHKNEHASQHKVHFEKGTLGTAGGGGTGGANGRHWSPYGCHYFPDPRAFPQPNLDSLPHEPLKRGEQYYLDLAGNIRKGPVGVGYTCYCAPFFRHMEARLDRDKQELKQHIDQAHQRLDQKVSSLERRTQGRLTELTRCVAAERAMCERRHARLERWLALRPPPHPGTIVETHYPLEPVVVRGAPLRRSERQPPRRELEAREAVTPVARARSLEMLLTDDRAHGERCEDGDPTLDGSWWRGARPLAAELQRSCEALLEGPRDSPASPTGFKGPAGSSCGPVQGRRAFPLGVPLAARRTEVGNGSGGADETCGGRRPAPLSPRPLDRSFDVLVGEGVAAATSSPPPPPQPRPRAPSRAPSVPRPPTGEATVDGRNDEEWAREQPVRRSVHEMVARFQDQARSPVRETPWRRSASSSRGRALSGGGGDGDDSASESSDGEDEGEGVGALPSVGGPDYENVAWRGDNAHLQALPYRSRTAVYSPMPLPHPGMGLGPDTPLDVHNDSGYSTRVCGGSSAGPSPQLSGHLDCDTDMSPSPQHQIHHQHQLHHHHHLHHQTQALYGHGRVGDSSERKNGVTASLV